MGLRKAVKPEFGGGTRSFSCEEDYIYENIESELCFFTSQVCLTHTHTHVRALVHTSLSSLPIILRRRGRASLNTGWTIYEPNTGRCCTTSASWRASQSVSCILHSLAAVESETFPILLPNGPLFDSLNVPCSPGAECARCDPAGFPSP